MDHSISMGVHPLPTNTQQPQLEAELVNAMGDHHAQLKGQQPYCIMLPPSESSHITEHTALCVMRAIWCVCASSKSTSFGERDFTTHAAAVAQYSTSRSATATNNGNETTGRNATNTRTGVTFSSDSISSSSDSAALILLTDAEVYAIARAANTDWKRNGGTNQLQDLGIASDEHSTPHPQSHHSFMVSHCPLSLLPRAARHTHSDRCRFVQLHTSANANLRVSPRAELKTRLHYVSLIYKQLLEAQNAAAAAAAAAAVTTTRSGASSESKESDANGVTTMSHLPIIEPHIRSLPDGRIALVVEDQLGVTLTSGVEDKSMASCLPLYHALPQAASSAVSVTDASAAVTGGFRTTLTPVSNNAQAPQSSPSAISVKSDSSSSPESSCVVDAVAVCQPQLLLMHDWLIIAVALAEELQRLHAQGLVHRALHPQTLTIQHWSLRRSCDSQYNQSSNVRSQSTNNSSSSSSEHPIIEPASSSSSSSSSSSTASSSSFSSSSSSNHMNSDSSSPSASPLPAIQFLDLHNCTRLLTSRADPDMSIDVKEMTRLMFLSPEQSGRATQRLVDARSDLYALGGIFYFLIVGSPPFEGNDVLELLHQHLARSPPHLLSVSRSSLGHPLHQRPLWTAFLELLDAIVHRLLAKQAEDRYQSTAGLTYDLKCVLKFVEAAAKGSHWSNSDLVASAKAIDSCTNSLKNFKIGQVDVHSTFRISQKLYGREEEVNALIATYERICTPPHKSQLRSGKQPIDTAIPAPVAAQLFLISGYSGIGKTSLVDELHKHIVRSRGLFARGKFDLLKRDASCLLQAFRSLILQLLLLDGGAATWKDKLVAACGPNLQALCEVMPELVRVAGEQAPLPPLGATDAMNRFNMTFLQFVGAIATASSPLTLVIDDLQWADQGSLALLRLLMTHEQELHLLIIGAYRSNEVGPTHPLMLLVEDLRASDRDAQSQLSDKTSLLNRVTPQPFAQRVTSVELEPLSVSDLTQLVVDFFRCDAETALPLAKVLQEKTRGNPFHVNTLLHSFYENQLLWFDFSNARWQWNLDAMRLTHVSEDVAHLVSHNMRKLSAECQLLLKYSACCGHQVNLRVLRSVLPRCFSLSNILQAVHTLEQNSMLICTSHAFDLTLLTAWAAGNQMNEHEDQPEDGMDGASNSAKSAANSGSHASDEPTDVEPPSDTSPSLEQLNARLEAIQFQFAHDKVQSAAFQLILPSELPVVHSIITAQLMKTYVGELEEYGSEIAGHIVDGLEAATTVLADGQQADLKSGREAWCKFFAQPGVISHVFNVLHHAAVQTKKAGAYDTAIRFLLAGIRLMQLRDVLERWTPASPIPPLFSRTWLTSMDVELVRLDKSEWKMSLPYSISIYTELCFCLFLAGRSACAQTYIDYALKHITDSSERGILFELHIPVLMTQGFMQQAVDTTLNYLSEIGVELVPNMSEELRAWVAGPPPFDSHRDETFRMHPVFALQPSSNPLPQNLLSSFTAALFFLKSPLFPRVVWTMLQLTKDTGTTPHSAFALSLYTMTLWASHTRYDENYSLGRVAKMLLDSFGEAGRPMAPRSNCALLGDTYPWHLPLRECYTLLEEGFADAFAMGDLEWGSYLGMYVAEMASLCGYDLPVALPKQVHTYQTLMKRKCTTIAPYCQAWIEFTQILMGLMPLYEADSLPSSDLHLIQFSSKSAQGLLMLIMNRPQLAVECMHKATPAKAANASLPSNIVYEFASALAKLAVMPQNKLDKSENDASSVQLADGSSNAPHHAEASLPSVSEWESNLADIDTHISMLRIWSRVAPHTFMHKLKLAEAERMRALIFVPSALAQPKFELMQQAIRLYEEAAEMARVNQYPLEAALTLELASRFQDQLYGHTNSVPSKALRSQSILLYDQVGAKAKVDLMKRMFPNDDYTQLSMRSSASTAAGSTAGGRADSPQTFGVSDLSLSGIHSVTPAIELPKGVILMDEESNLRQIAAGGDQAASLVVPASRLDALSVLKAVASFSTETDSARLRQKLMAIMLETAGATRGALILHDVVTGWKVELAASVEGEEETGPEDIKSPYQSPVDLPNSVIQFVIDSGESVLLSEPHRDPFSLWRSEPYFARAQPKALLALPVLKAGQVCGVLLLTNSFRVDAFSASSIQLLQLLCTQAALSIDNVKLYAQLSTQNRDLEEVVRARTHELQLAKERAEKATAVKADFLSSMSHEIRTPLNAVLGMGRLLSDSQLTLEQSAYVSMIEVSGQLLLSIINDILEFSKIEAGKVNLVRAPCNVLDLVEGATMLCAQMIASKGLQGSMQVQPNLPPLLMIDATRLQQILLNLLSNAIKFTKKGSVTISVRRVDQNHTDSTCSEYEMLQEGFGPWATPTCTLEFSVTDTGIGISNSNLQTLFHSFHQLQPSSEFGGTGLGLVISKRLVESMGGEEISVESKPGEGSSFRFTLTFDIAQSLLQQQQNSTSSPIAPSQSPVIETDSPNRSQSQASAVSVPISSNSSSSSSSTPHRNLHGLTRSQVAELHGIRVYVLMASSQVSAQPWIQLLRSYVGQLVLYGSVEEWEQGESHSHKEVPPTQPDQKSLTSVYILDLDAPLVSEEAFLSAWQRLRGTAAIYLLSLSNQRYMAPLVMQDQAGHSALAGTGIAQIAYAAVPFATTTNSTLPPTALAVSLPQMHLLSLHRELLCKPLKQEAFLRMLLKLARAQLRDIRLGKLPVNNFNNLNDRRLSPSNGESSNSNSNSNQGSPLHPSETLSARSTPAPGSASDADSSSPEQVHRRPALTSLMLNPQTHKGVTGGAGPTTPGGTLLTDISQPHHRPTILKIANEYPLKVLLTEDNLINQKMMVMTMRRLGYEILVASNGQQALNILEVEAAKGKKHEIQCILMDISMDGMDGEECSRVIRAQQLPHRVRPYIIAQTANVTEECRERCYKAGCDAFLVKPIRVEELAQHLMQAYRAIRASAAAAKSE